MRMSPVFVEMGGPNVLLKLISPRFIHSTLSYGPKRKGPSSMEKGISDMISIVYFILRVKIWEIAFICSKTICFVCSVCGNYYFLSSLSEVHRRNT